MGCCAIDSAISTVNKKTKIGVSMKSGLSSDDVSLFQKSLKEKLRCKDIWGSITLRAQKLIDGLKEFGLVQTK